MQHLSFCSSLDIEATFGPPVSQRVNLADSCFPPFSGFAWRSRLRSGSPWRSSSIAPRPEMRWEELAINVRRPSAFVYRQYSGFKRDMISCLHRFVSTAFFCGLCCVYLKKKKVSISVCSSPLRVIGGRLFWRSGSRSRETSCQNTQVRLDAVAELWKPPLTNKRVQHWYHLWTLHQLFEWGFQTPLLRVCVIDSAQFIWKECSLCFKHACKQPEVDFNLIPSKKQSCSDPLLCACKKQEASEQPLSLPAGRNDRCSGFIAALLLGLCRLVSACRCAEPDVWCRETVWICKAAAWFSHAGAFAYDVCQPPQHRPDSGGLCQQCPVPARVKPEVFHSFIHLKLGMLTINRCRLRI